MIEHGHKGSVNAFLMFFRSWQNLEWKNLFFILLESFVADRTAGWNAEGVNKDDRH